MPRTIEFTIEEGDIRDCKTDVILLKHAQGYYGADRKVAEALSTKGIEAPRPAINDHALIGTQGAVAADQALFVGTPKLRQFGYSTIRLFMKAALEAVITDAPGTRHLAMTIHGANTFMRLDEAETFLAQFMVILSSAQMGDLPRKISRITVVEREPDRARRLRRALDDFLAKDRDVIPTSDQRGYHLPVGIAHKKRPHVFVAMSFDANLEDTYFFGIQRPIQAAGLQPNRVDHTLNPGDIFRQIKRGIAAAELVVADLTGLKPNVFLEVGYALGKGKESRLIPVIRNGEQLPFDVQGLRCIMYENEKDLRVVLTKAINQHIARTGLEFDGRERTV